MYGTGTKSTDETTPGLKTWVNRLIDTSNDIDDKKERRLHVRRQVLAIKTGKSPTARHIVSNLKALKKIYKTYGALMEQSGDYHDIVNDIEFINRNLAKFWCVVRDKVKGQPSNLKVKAISCDSFSKFKF